MKGQESLAMQRYVFINNSLVSENFIQRNVIKTDSDMLKLIYLQKFVIYAQHS